jgi:anthranilate phosphoribosyltransferase
MKALAEAAALCRNRIDLPDTLVPQILKELLEESNPLADKADFLRALTDKGETAAELATFTRELLPLAVDPGFRGTWNGKALFDCCGTGGGGLQIFNVSTGTVFILAALGVPVVKHGNRGVTKKSGSADVLATLGIRTDLSPEETRSCMEKVGAVFFFAPKYHPAFAKIATVRKQLGSEGRRTVFNLLGPLLNPSCPDTQLIGVFLREQLPLFDATLRTLGRQRHTVIWGRDAASGRAIGEVSVSGINEILGNAGHSQWRIPAVPGELRELEVETAEESAARIVAILRGEEHGLGRLLLAVNAAVGLCVQGNTVSFAEALAAVNETIDSGRALRKLEQWQSF